MYTLASIKELPILLPVCPSSSLYSDSFINSDNGIILDRRSNTFLGFEDTISSHPLFKERYDILIIEDRVHGGIIIMKDRNYKIITVLAMILAVTGLSIAYAAYTSTLRISGNVTARASEKSWNVKFDEDKDVHEIQFIFTF